MSNVKNLSQLSWWSLEKTCVIPDGPEGITTVQLMRVLGRPCQYRVTKKGPLLEYWTGVYKQSPYVIFPAAGGSLERTSAWVMRVRVGDESTALRLAERIHGKKAFFQIISGRRAQAARLALVGGHVGR